ncbi:hypothetical protein CBER1_01729 [Cercospora berteroae]|uniref:Uncharacterized protein n=1 Tax=Cercospora berteroae TaxID=357750 RepID=A0A2S6CHC8_9PEZI|nr:hypothetical protein CBER1_01729 [Cercospora berteroae]
MATTATLVSSAAASSPPKEHAKHESQTLPLDMNFNGSNSDVRSSGVMSIRASRMASVTEQREEFEKCGFRPISTAHTVTTITGGETGKLDLEAADRARQRSRRVKCQEPGSDPHAPLTTILNQRERTMPKVRYRPILTVVIHSPLRGYSSPVRHDGNEFNMRKYAQTAKFRDLLVFLMKIHHVELPDVQIMTTGQNLMDQKPPLGTLLIDLGFRDLQVVNVIPRLGVKKGFRWDITIDLGKFFHGSHLLDFPIQFCALETPGTQAKMSDIVEQAVQYLTETHKLEGERCIKRLDKRLRYGARIMYDSQCPEAYAAAKTLDWVGRDERDHNIRFHLILYDRHDKSVYFDQLLGDRGDSAWYEAK